MTHAALVQPAEDGILGGHEVFFQTPGPRAQLRCFLETRGAGEATLAAPDACVGR